MKSSRLFALIIGIVLIGTAFAHTPGIYTRYVNENYFPDEITVTDCDVKGFVIADSVIFQTVLIPTGTSYEGIKIYRQVMTMFLWFSEEAIVSQTEYLVVEDISPAQKVLITLTGHLQNMDEIKEEYLSMLNRKNKRSP